MQLTHLQPAIVDSHVGGPLCLFMNTEHMRWCLHANQWYYSNLLIALCSLSSFTFLTTTWQHLKTKTTFTDGRKIHNDAWSFHWVFLLKQNPSLFLFPSIHFRSYCVPQNYTLEVCMPQYTGKAYPEENLTAQGLIFHSSGEKFDCHFSLILLSIVFDIFLICMQVIHMTKFIPNRVNRPCSQNNAAGVQLGKWF